MVEECFAIYEVIENTTINLFTPEARTLREAIKDNGHSVPKTMIVPKGTILWEHSIEQGDGVPTTYNFGAVSPEGRTPGYYWYFGCSFDIWCMPERRTLSTAEIAPNVRRKVRRASGANCDVWEHPGWP